MFQKDIDTIIFSWCFHMWPTCFLHASYMFPSFFPHFSTCFHIFDTTRWPAATKQPSWPVSLHVSRPGRGTDSELCELSEYTYIIWCIMCVCLYIYICTYLAIFVGILSLWIFCPRLRTISGSQHRLPNTAVCRSKSTNASPLWQWCAYSRLAQLWLEGQSIHLRKL